MTLEDLDQIDRLRAALAYTGAAYSGPGATCQCGREGGCSLHTASGERREVRLSPEVVGELVRLARAALAFDGDVKRMVDRHNEQLGRTMSKQIDVLGHRFDAYQQAVATLVADHGTVAARKAAIHVRDEFLSDMPLLIADALVSYRRCQRALATTMVDRLADKQLTVRSTIESLAKDGWLSEDDAAGILAALPQPQPVSEHLEANGSPIDGYPLQQA